MRGPQPKPIVLTERLDAILRHIVRCGTMPYRLVRRVQIVLEMATGANNAQVARRLDVHVSSPRLWRGRWLDADEQLQAAEAAGADDKALIKLIEGVLADAPRSGAPVTFTPEQVVQIVALACESPPDSGRPVSHWSHQELADEAVKRGLVPRISGMTVGRFLKEADLKPHKSRYWLNACPEDAHAFSEQVRTVCQTYTEAPTQHEQGVHTVSTDEKTGIQALERKNPTLPMQPGRVERREFEYIRHGTQTLMANFEVATGQVVAPSLGATRTETDFVEHVARTVALDPDGGWIFVTDRLNIHMSASLVRLVAERCGLDVDLGVKEKHGILRSTRTRAAFLQDPSHRIRFVYTPKHTSWLNQVELWLSILARRLLKRASFASVEELRQRILAFIDYFNRAMAKPFKWTYAGKPLQV